VAPALVVVGSTQFDLLLKLPRLPRSNDRLRPSAVVLVPGGMAGNVASAFVRLGGAVRYAGAFKADDGVPSRLALAPPHDVEGGQPAGL
jgi:sugar/nucleoside kinase (ribokinase family)